MRQVLCFILLERQFAAVQIRHQGAKARSGEAVRNAFDLIIQAPPFLHRHQAWATFSRGRLG
jgi:hypothetical protein